MVNLNKDKSNLTCTLRLHVHLVLEVKGECSGERS